MPWTTHEVFNQTPVLQDYNLFDSDTVLRDAVLRAAGSGPLVALSGLGAQLGRASMQALAAAANRAVPQLHTHDACGQRIDFVAFHPAWQQLLDLLMAGGVHCSDWAMPRAGAGVVRAAAFFLHGQIEAGSLCPITMTHAAIPVLRREPALFRKISGKLFSRQSDARDLPLPQKHSAMIGMGMTEKQGGSDMRSNTTIARARQGGGRGQGYSLVGHKWFFSAPMCDAHLVLAHADEALSCFYVPRWREDGSRNAIRIQRLKDKLGNRSNASAEVEFHEADALLVGEPGKGINTIIEMAAHTRLDCILGSAALIRQAFVQALHHAHHRAAFGKTLIEHPLMSNVLADIALESEAATALALRLAHACEAAPDHLLERAIWRIVVPAAKFWVCKRAIDVMAECMEVLGGNGYVEDGPLARMYREAPVNSIWEGSGNLMCLDVLRSMRREPEIAGALWSWLRGVHAEDAACMAALAQGQRLAGLDDEFHARALARLLVLLVQAALLRQHAPQPIADGFVISRLCGTHDVFGLQDGPVLVTFMLQRAWAE